MHTQPLAETVVSADGYGGCFSATLCAHKNYDFHCCTLAPCLVILLITDCATMSCWQVLLNWCCTVLTSRPIC